MPYIDISDHSRKVVGPINGGGAAAGRGWRTRSEYIAAHRTTTQPTEPNGARPRNDAWVGHAARACRQPQANTMATGAQSNRLGKGMAACRALAIFVGVAGHCTARCHGHGSDGRKDVVGIASGTRKL